MNWNPHRVRTLVRTFARMPVLLLAFALLLGAAPMAAGSLQGVVNLNTANAEQLSQLPGIGEARAQAIVGLRKQQGSFKTVEELLAVKGIGDKALTRLRPFLALEGKTTLRQE